MSKQAIAAWLIGIISFVYVLCCFDSIWPMASVDVGKPKDVHIEQARQFLEEQGIDHQGYQPFVRLAVREEVLDVLQSEQSLETASEYAREPNGLVRYYVRFKRQGTPKRLAVVLHPDGGLIGFSQDDDPDLEKGGYSEEAFRRLAADWFDRYFGVALADLEEVKFDSEIRDGVIHYRLDAQRPFKGSPSLNEIFAFTTGGKTVTAMGRRIVLTEAASLEMKRLEGPEEALSQLGYLLFGISLVLIYIFFLFELRKGQIDLVPSLKVALVLFAMVLASALLDANSRFQAWDPVWPPFTKWTRLISQQSVLALWALVLGWVVLAGGTVAPGGGREKMTSFWHYVRFRWHRPEIALASLRGGALGFFCGAVAILMVKALESFCGGEVGLQPRAFYLSILDRQWPALAVVLFFFPIAVVEEGGYRLFAALWIRHLTRSRILGIVIPAIVFGVIHTSLGFLPPESPWWGRALVMMVIGLIWGWAFFRFDFLTVILCHLMADIVIFCWPLLISEHGPSQVMAAIAISVPLWPAAIGGWRSVRMWLSARKSLAEQQRLRG